MSAGQLSLVPSQDSATSQLPDAAGRQTKFAAAVMRAQVPIVPPFSTPLQDTQSAAPPAQALAQQTPSPQKELSHWLADVHASPFVLRSANVSNV